jgi:D-serine deaminase-like pyridoxal phosphate-dependent protein
MAWEGHASGLQDPEEKRRQIEKAVNLLNESVQLCRDAGLPVTIVSGGGSGTYQVTPFLPGITEIQAGGAIFCDVSYQSWGVKTQPSLFVRSIVTSRPAPDRIIFDVGFKSLPTWAGKPKPIGLSGVKSIGMSAEHGTVILDADNSSVKVGDVFDFIVGYGDSTVFLHDDMYGIRDDVVEVVWRIQGRGKIR